MSILNEYQEVLDELDGIQIQEYANEKDKEIFEYQAFVQKQMKKQNIKSISEMELPQRARFFKECEEIWEKMKANDKTPKDLKMMNGEKPTSVAKPEKPKHHLKERGVKNLDELNQPGKRLKRWMGVDEGDADEGNLMAESWTNKQRRKPRKSRSVNENAGTKKIDRKIAEIEAILKEDRKERHLKKRKNLNESEATRNPKDLVGKVVSSVTCGDGHCTIVAGNYRFTVKGGPDINPNKAMNNLQGKTIRKARYRQGVLTIIDENGGIVRFGKDHFGQSKWG